MANKAKQRIYEVPRTTHFDPKVCRQVVRQLDLDPQSLGGLSKGRPNANSYIVLRTAVILTCVSGGSRGFLYMGSAAWRAIGRGLYRILVAKEKYMLPLR